MTQRISRRDLVRTIVVTAAAPALGACGSDSDEPEDDPPSEEEIRRTYPQGVASGDPKPGSVILWTRVQTEDDADPIVRYEVALDDGFSDVVVSDETTAEAAADRTVRIKVTGLDPFTTYYYRFRVNGVPSRVGRTKTAPEPDADVTVRFAFASCQDYIGRSYHPWKALADDEDGVDFVLHLGDYVYETDGDPSFMTPGEERNVVLPDGLDLGGDTKAALSLDDYRTLYKTYRSDRHLQRAHELFPFVCIWDDHEFANDAWQDHATHFSDTRGDEKSTERREAADRAWFEYQPADVDYDDGASYPDDIRIYRSLRFGKHLELVLTDERYYRDEHIVPEGPTALDVGKIIEDSSIGSRIFVLKDGFDVREAAELPTMLGSAQKAWLVDALKSSNATWKVWGSEVQLAQMVADLRSFESVAELVRNRFYLTVDQWDGYRSERAEILAALEEVDNVVVLAGDIHAFYASELHADFDQPGAPVAVEYVVAGISSQGLASGAEAVLASDQSLRDFGLLELIPRFDELLLEGNPHYRYANSTANGIAICELSAESFDATFWITGDPRDESDSGVKERVSFTTRAGSRTIERR